MQLLCGTQSESSTPAVPRRLRGSHRTFSVVLPPGCLRYPERVHPADRPVPLAIRPRHYRSDNPAIPQAVPAALPTVLPRERNIPARDRVIYCLHHCHPLFGDGCACLRNWALPG